LALVPHIWIELLNYLARKDIYLPSLRYITNSGGHFPEKYVGIAEKFFPNAQIYLMYGLTEAFRSTYLPPNALKNKSGSIGRAIPSVEILVLNSELRPCQPFEQGELVHCGSLISGGYWNDKNKTDQVFKKYPLSLEGEVIDRLVVFSGDIVSMDEEGYLYFHSRKDGLIKSYGFRINLGEIEKKAYEFSDTVEAVALSKKREDSNHDIFLVVKLVTETSRLDFTNFLKNELPSYMIPSKIHYVEEFPLNSNGKIDRIVLKTQYVY
jgi:acyl-CoA synthetase (AMP-forming)/AMP-acid ligase II